MNSAILALGVLLICCLAGCSPNSDEKASAVVKQEPQHIFKDQVNALDKAKGLEQDMDKTYERRNMEMDERAQ